MISKNWLITIMIGAISSIPSLLSALEHVSVSFYSEELELQYDPDIILDQKVSVEENHMVNYFKTLKKKNYQPFLQQLKDYQKNHNLNDWLYFELLQKSVAQLLSKQEELARELTTWFLLAESGFDVRLTYSGEMVFLYIFTVEELYEVPMIEEGSKVFASLSNLHGKPAETASLYLLNFVPNPNGRAFSFYLQRLPILNPDIVQKTFQISYKDTTYQLTFDSDRTIVNLMKDYPLVAEIQYFNVPFSTVAAQSLFPQLRSILKDRSKQEAIELLVAFTRSSFQYKEDKLHFGFSKPMIAEEVFHHPYSDCEDRSALFFSLVKELLDLPMIIIAFKDHITIGVALPDFNGEAITYKGKKYYICDPTGPVNSTRIRYFPKGYTTKPFDIIGSYN